MPTKSLVIVESPAKARTISKFLGKSFSVVSSMGHIVDLPAKKLGIEVENNYKADLVVITGKKKLLAELRKHAKGADSIYFATDPDREGEAIGWNLKEWMKLKDQAVYRVEFHEITKSAIEAAFKMPRKFDEDKIRAQQARRILDRLVGYFLSPLLWRKVTRGLSAGRVQSVALRLIVDREKEIQAFVPSEYWSIEAQLKKKEGQPKDEKAVFTAVLDKIDNEKAGITGGETASKIIADIGGKDFIITAIEKNIRNKNPQAPFITSSLQQEAFNKLRFSPTKTMFIAQQLYEGIEVGQEGPVGLITYMRTDSTNVAQSAIAEVRSFIEKDLGKEYLPESPRIYKSKKLAQEAHEAIRPTQVGRSPQEASGFLTPEQAKLYELIWKRFVASQMNPAQIEQTGITIACGKYLFRATGSTIVFPGFTALYKIDEEEQEDDKKKNRLPILENGEALALVELMPGQHFTKPPARFSEASLIKALEEDGVGRPSTYAPIISTIVNRDYARREKGYLMPTDLGVKVSELLVEYFPQVMDITFTAHMEDELDLVEEGKVDWVNILNEFYGPFKEKLDYASANIKKEVIYSDEICSLCGKPMVIKWGRKGKFLSCSDYPTCKNAKSITSGVKCPAEGCGGDLILRRSYRGRSFYGCSNYPKCTFTSRELPSEETKSEAGSEQKNEP
ncbi:MAG TPA: type I DNA topoisomerase [Candidatus Omnitrophica bacterium]|nr:type I DNA topoisomerase [Candidatus Omnitrophota bacterium]